MRKFDSMYRDDVGEGRRAAGTGFNPCQSGPEFKLAAVGMT
jgi:hypothetical protein